MMAWLENLDARDARLVTRMGADPEWSDGWEAVFEPFQLDGHHYMDGGIIDSVPLRFAKTLQPDLIIAVDLSIKSTFKTPDYKSRVLSTIFRAFEVVEEDRRFTLRRYGRLDTGTAGLAQPVLLVPPLEVITGSPFR